MPAGITPKQQAYAKEVFAELIETFKTQEEIADRLGINQSRVSNIRKTGRTSLQVLVAGAKLAGRSPDEIADRTGLFYLRADTPTAEPVQPTVSLNDLSANAAEAMKAYDWDGVSAAEYDRVRATLVAQHAGDGIDRFASWWTSQIRRLLRENRPTAKSADHRDSPDPPFNPDEPSPERQAQVAARDAKKKPKR